MVSWAYQGRVGLAGGSWGCCCCFSLKTKKKGGLFELHLKRHDRGALGLGVLLPPVLVPLDRDGLLAELPHLPREGSLREMRKVDDGARSRMDPRC